MVLPVKRSDGTYVWPKDSVMPKESVKNTKYEGTIEVHEGFSNKSEVDQKGWTAESTPDRPFAETIDAVNKDPRLNLSNETYVQMILGKGLRVTAKKQSVADKVTDWLENIEWDEKLEDGLYSYCGGGNMMYEHDPTFEEWVEVPMPTVESILRKKDGTIKSYKLHVNDNDIYLKPKDVEHFKLTNVAREPFGRGLHHSVLSRYENPDTGEVFDSPLIQMKEMEDAMPKIFKGHADPTTMFYFADAGEQFIKNQADALKKMKKGSKIVTDKEFDVKIIEASGNGKFSEYIEHIQRDLLEPGSKFPLQFFNAGFTARAASESTDSVLTRKVKRIQERLAKQILNKMILPYLKFHGGASVKAKDIQVFFETPQKQEVTVVDVTTAFRDNLIKRSEARKWFITNSSIDINEEDMEDLAPITSVTPTNNMDGEEPETKPIKKEEPKEEKVKKRNK
jgi:hypothetical protein